MSSYFYVLVFEEAVEVIETVLCYFSIREHTHYFRYSWDIQNQTNIVLCKVLFQDPEVQYNEYILIMIQFKELKGV